jgi:imidazoleglycerol-phosphate dehydratase
MNRQAEIKRNTNETKVSVSLNLDGNREITIDTGIPFLDHMLTLVAFHAGFDLSITCVGDLEVDCHHSVEDVGLAFGKALDQALGDKKGIERFASVYIPMDESLSRVVVDLSGRPYLVLNAEFERIKIGTMDVQNIREFFKSFVNEAKLNLHIELLYGENDHHKAESIFKGFGRALKQAVRNQGNSVESTKGVL